MINKTYIRQVTLLLKVLPEVSKERDFALHGGTAINLFIRNTPRLSVDIDLTYIPIEPRAVSLKKINIMLEKIKSRLQKVIPYVRVQHKKKSANYLFPLKVLKSN